MMARMLSSTARSIWSSVTAAPVSAAFSVIFRAAAFASGRLGHSPVRALVRSSAGCSGQSLRAQLGPCACRLESTSLSPSDLKNSAHA